MTFFDAAILGVTQGVMEFLPVSSTGHLILVSKLLGIEQTNSHKAFEVAMMLGATLAILFLYFKKLKQNPKVIEKLAVGFIPAGILGFLFYKTIKDHFNSGTVVVMLALGGVILLLIEKYFDKFSHSTTHVEDVTFKQAFFIGIAQSFSMIPGTSRSAATIIGGLFTGLNRQTAFEFSFLLALPTVFMATIYDLYKNSSVITSAEYGSMAIGFAFAFFTALLTVRFFTAFVTKNGFMVFGIYRIVLAIVYWYFIL